MLELGSTKRTEDKTYYSLSSFNYFNQLNNTIVWGDELRFLSFIGRTI